MCRQYYMERKELILSGTYNTDGMIGDIVLAIDVYTSEILPYIVTISENGYCDILQLIDNKLHFTKRVQLSADVTRALIGIKNKELLILSNESIVQLNDSYKAIWQLDWIPSVNDCIYTKLVITLQHDNTLMYQLFSLNEEGVVNSENLLDANFIPSDYWGMLVSVVIHWRFFNDRYEPLFIINTTVNQTLVIHNSNVLYCIDNNSSVINISTIEVR